MSAEQNGSGLKFLARIDIAAAKRDAEDLKKVLADLKIDPSASTAGTKAAQLALQLALKDSRLETQRLKQEQQRLRTEYEKGRVDTQSYRSQVAALTLQQKQNTQAARDARSAQVAAIGSYKEAQQRLSALGNEIKNATGGFKNQTPEIRAQIKEYNELNAKLTAFDATMGNHQRNVGNYSGALKNTVADLLSFATAYTSAGAALQYVFSSTLQFQSLKTPLTYILGSEGDANNKLAELKKLANDLGIEYFALADSYRSFTAAARASNFDLDKSEKIFTSVAKAGAVLHLSSDQMNGAFTAIQQMISKGNVQAEELRGQLSERLPGAFSLAAKAMGVTEQELNKLLQTGSVVASDLLPKLAEQLDKTYGDKAAGGIRGLNAELNGLKSALQSLAGEGSALSTNLFEPIIRGAKNTALELSQFFRGSFTENIRYALTFSNKSLADQRKAYDLRDANSNNTNALQSSRKNNLSDMGLGNLRTAYTQIDATYKQAVRDYKAFEAGVKNGTLKETNKATVASFFNVAAGLREERKRIGEELDKQKGQVVTGNKEIADSMLTAVADIRKRISQLQKMSGSADPTSDVAKRIEALQARIKKGGDAAGESLVKSRNSLQAQIDALTKKGVAKEKSATEQELAAVDAKYAALRKKANDFNNDPVNKKKGLRVDAGGLVTAQAKETTDVYNKQDARNLKVTLDEQKKLYTEYEDFKSKVGETKAKERYANLIDTDITYLEKLKQLESAQTDPQKSKGGSEAQANPYAMKLLAEQIAAEKIAEQKKYDDLVTQFMSYADKRKKLTEEFNATMLALENDPSAQAEKRAAYEQELGDLDDSNAKKLSAFKALFAGVDRLSDENAKKVVSNADDLLKHIMASGGNISKELADQIRQLLANTTKEIANRMPERIINLANQIDQVAEAVSQVDENFGKMLHTIGNVVGQVGNIKKGLGDFKLAQGTGDSLGQLTAGLGIFSAGLSIVSGIAKLFDRSAEREAQQAYATENQTKQNEALNKALERQVSLINDAYGTDKLAKYAEAQATILKNEQIYTDQLKNRYSLTGNKQVDDILTKVNQTGNTGLLDFVKDKSVFDKYKIPAGDIKALRALLDDGTKLDDNTKAIVENLINAKQAFIDLDNQMKSDTIGSTLGEIADTFIQNLTDGTQDFGKTFEDTIRKSILNGFKGQIIKEQLQGFYDQFAASTKDGSLTPDEIEALRKSYLAASEKAKKDFADLEKATGINLTDSASGSNKNTLSGAIKNASQESIDLLAGQTGGMRLAQLQTNALLVPIGKGIGDLSLIAQSNFEVQVRIEANTLRTANNTDALAAIRDGIASMDKKIGNSNAALLANGRL